MKNLVFIGIIALLISACGSSEKLASDSKVVRLSPIVVTDTVEYEISISEPGFHFWFLQYQSKGFYRSLSYYKYWNLRYVIDWNHRISWNNRGFETETNIYIDVNKINDLDIQHEIFYYFQYVEKEMKLKIIYGASPRNL